MKNISQFLEKAEQWFVGATLLLITFLLFINVVMRFVFSANISWAEEFARYAIVWITFIGAAICIYKGGHISVDAIFSLLSPGGKQFLNLAISLVCMIFSIALAYISLNLTLTVMSTGQISSTLGVPMMYIYGAMPIGFALMAIRYGLQLMQLMRHSEGGNNY